jgi:SAM-dependent methyltransferase
MADTNCPVCSSGNTRKLFGLRAREAGRLLKPDHPEQAGQIAGQIAQLWQSDTCEFFHCQRCGYGFARPYRAGNELIYSALYYEDFSYPEDKWEYSRALEIIRDLYSAGDGRYGSQAPQAGGATLLEVGAGNGSFLDKISSDDFPAPNIYSTEFSDAGAKAIRKKGYHCFNRAVQDLAQENIPRFDVICMFQVLEHMDNLDPVFRSLNHLGRSSSHLIIAVPNGRLRFFYDRMGVHLDVPPVHVGRFMKRTFHFLGEKNGWQVNGLYVEPQKYRFKAKKFISDRYVRVAFTRKTDRSKSWPLRYFFRYGCLLVLSVRFLPVLLYILLPGTGTSLLVHYQKQADL